MSGVSVIPPSCSNCRHLLNETDRFCSQCGQTTATRITSFRVLTYEVISDFFSWDSRWFQTIGPFLFRPGYLTQAFITGKYARYMPPLRLYFFASLLCFSAFALYAPKADETKERLEKALYTDSLRLVIMHHLSDSLSPAEREKFRSALQLLTIEEIPEKKQVSVRLADSLPTQNPTSGNQMDEKKYLYTLAQNPLLSEKQILDSLRWKDTYWNRFKINRVTRLTSMSSREFLQAFFDRIPTFMFIVLPFIALAMKLLYIRRGRLYIEHLIFMMHIHSFVFFMLALLMLLKYTLKWEVAGWIGGGILLYIWFAFYRVYGQRWGRTSLKMLSFLIIYFILCSGLMLTGMAVTALLY